MIDNPKRSYEWKTPLNMKPEFIYISSSNENVKCILKVTAKVLID